MNVKQQVQDIVSRLGENCTFEDVLYHLYVAELTARRLARAESGAAVPHEEALKRLESWRTK